MLWENPLITWYLPLCGPKVRGSACASKRPNPKPIVQLGVRKQGAMAANFRGLFSHKETPLRLLQKLTGEKELRPKKTQNIFCLRSQSTVRWNASSNKHTNTSFSFVFFSLRFKIVFFIFILSSPQLHRIKRPLSCLSMCVSQRWRVKVFVTEYLSFLFSSFRIVGDKRIRSTSVDVCECHQAMVYRHRETKLSQQSEKCTNCRENGD